MGLMFEQNGMKEPVILYYFCNLMVSKVGVPQICTCQPTPQMENYFFDKYFVINS